MVSGVRFNLENNYVILLFVLFKNWPRDSMARAFCFPYEGNSVVR